MNFIQLARMARKRVGLQGTGPSSVSTTGYDAALVAYVQDAWADIQNERNQWRWMRSEASFMTSSGNGEYLLGSIFSPGYRFNRWHKDTCYTLYNSKWTKVRFVEYDKFIELTQNQTEEGKVSYYTIRPQDSALLFNTPDAPYSIKIDYQKSLQELVSDADVPELPDQFHRLIIYGAVMNYSEELGRQGKFNYYSIKYTRMLNLLMRNQLPKEILKMRPLV